MEDQEPDTKHQKSQQTSANEKSIAQQRKRRSVLNIERKNQLEKDQDVFQELFDNGMIEREEFEFINKQNKKNITEHHGRFDVHGKTLYFSEKSLWILSSKNALRKALVWLIKWKWFDRAITFIIILNTINLSLYDYSDRDSLTAKNKILDKIDLVLTYIFLCEAIIKILAMGLVMHRFSYLREGWNVIDFIIASTGVIELLSYDVNLKALRTLRVMRPLRSIKASPSIRRQVTTLVSAIPELANATLFILFITLIFAVLGLQQFSGIMYYRCRTSPKPLNSTYWPKSQQFTRVCSPGGDGEFSCPKGLYCGSPLEFGISLQDDGVYEDPKIQFGVSSFDNMAQAFLGVFQIITIENWTLLMYNFSDGYTHLFSKIYFCMIVIIGHYYILQLLLAVLSTNLTKIISQEAFSEIQKNRDQVAIDKKNLALEEANSAQENRAEEAKTETKDKNPMSEMAKALKAARAKKLEAQRLAEEEAKKKEAMQTQPMTSMGQLSAAIKRAKEEKAAREAALKQQEEEAKNANPQELKEREEKLAKEKEIERQKQIDAKIKDNLMWNVGGNSNENENQGMSNGLGLALLSKALGVQNIEDKFQKHITNIKKTKIMANLELRKKLQRKIRDDISRLTNQSNLDVSKMYWRSKKNVYGIDNELHLVEQVQKCMTGVFGEQILKKTAITHEIVKNIFESEQEKMPKKIKQASQKVDGREFSDSSSDSEETNIEMEITTYKPQLDVHTFLALKIAFNLKELTYQQNLKNFFFSRFKRRLIKKSIIDNIQLKIEKYLIETDILMRAKQQRIYAIVNYLTRTKSFKTITVLVILANTVVLGLTHSSSSKQFDGNIEICNLGFFGFFMFELIAKLIGQGFKHYIRDKFNWFDGLVVFVSAVDIVLSYSVKSSDSAGSGALTALRVFRLIRIFQLAKFWKEFQELLKVTISTISDITNITLLMMIFIFCYMLIGMELYAYKLQTNDLLIFDPDYKHQSNFNTLLESFLSVFIILANDGWTRVYIDHYRVTNSILASIFFISLIIVGQLVLLNLFISILIENFEQISIKNDIVQRLSELKSKSIWVKLTSTICFWRKNEQVQTKDTKSLIDAMMDEKYIEEQRIIDEEKLQSPSLFIFKYDSQIRRYCRGFVEGQTYEWIMVVVIAISSLQLAIDSPLNDPNTITSILLQILDYILTGIFLLELLVKLIAHGLLFCGSKSYLKNQLNILDLFIVGISIISYLLETINLNSIKVLKILRILRPLRMISKNQGLKASINCLVVAVPSIAEIIFLLILFLYIFGIISVNYFKGSLYNCSTEGLQSQYKKLMHLFIQTETKWDCLNSGGDWKNKFLNFDNVPEAMATLFVMSNSVQWSDIMYHATKLKTYDYQVPSITSLDSPLTSFYFVLIIILGNFFVMNLFIGVIISKYNRERDILGKDMILSEQQKKWVKNRLNIIQSQPKFSMRMPYSQWRQPFYFISENKIFQIGINICIVINTVILTLQWYGISQELNDLLENLNFIFTLIFIFEFLIKIIGYGKRYFKDGWNTFDMIIVTISIAGILFSQYADQNLGPQSTIIRSFRIVRVFFFFKKNKALKNTLMTFLVCLPAMANIGSLLLLIILMYAIFGVYVFAEVQPSGALNEHANFQNLQSSFLTLIRVATGEEWPRIMEAVSRQHSPQFQCIENPTYQDYVNNNIGTIFVRLFIAIILQTFKTTTERENKFMNGDLSEKFRNTWAMFDPDATSFISIHCYKKFLLALGEPLGWNVTFNHNFIKQQEYLAEISLPKHNTGTEYYFMDVFEQLLLIMIIRREIINFAVQFKHFELLGVQTDRMLKENYYDELISNLNELPQRLSQVHEFINNSKLCLDDHQSSQATISNYENVKGGPFIMTSETFFDTPNPNPPPPLSRLSSKKQQNDLIYQVDQQEGELKVDDNKAFIQLNTSNNNDKLRSDVHDSLFNSQQIDNIEIKYESEREQRYDNRTQSVISSNNQKTSSTPKELTKIEYEEIKIQDDIHTGKASVLYQQTNSIRDFRFEAQRFEPNDEYVDILNEQEDEDDLINQELYIHLSDDDENRASDLEEDFDRNMEIVNEELLNLDAKKDFPSQETDEEQQPQKVQMKSAVKRGSLHLQKND